MSRFNRVAALVLPLLLGLSLLEAAPATAEEPGDEPVAETVPPPSPPSPPLLPDPDPPTPTGYVEGVSVRDTSATTPYRVEYENPDGTRTAVITPGLSRFEDADGNWHDTDYSLVEAADGSWTAASAVDSPKFLPSSQGQLVQFPASPGISLGFVGSADSQGVLIDDDHVVRYPAALSGGRDVLLSVVTGGVEHQVVVPNREAGAAYELNMTLPEARSAVEVETGVEIVDQVGAMVGGLFDGYARDSAENPSTTHVSVGVVSQTTGSARIAATIDPAWFADPARVFPVIIDPTTYQSSTTWGALGMYPDDCPTTFNRYKSCDTFVTAPDPASRWSKTHDIRAGAGNGGQDRAMMQFPLDSMGTAGYQYHVTSSSVQVYNNYSAGPAGQTKVFELHPVTGPITERTNWYNQPLIDWASETYANIGRDSFGNSTGWVTFDNTSTAGRWMNGSLEAYGVAITAQDEAGADTWRTFYSAEGDSTRAPKLFLTYNRPPNAATLVSPANSATVTTASPTLTASASDPDGDAVQFYFEVATGPDFANIVVRSGWVGSSWTVPAGGINSNGTYYWRAHTSDGYQNTGPNTYRSIYVDVPPPPPPGAPVITSNSHPSAAATYDNPDLHTTWTNTPNQAIDGYSIVIDRVRGTTPDAVVDQTGPAKYFYNLDDGTHWVHVRAHNAGGWGPAGEFQANVATVTATSDGLGREQFYPYDAKDLGTATAYVGLHNGNLVVSQDDEKIPGEGLSVVARRTYNSQSSVDAGMGPGWSLSLADVDAGLENVDVVDEAASEVASGNLDPDVSVTVTDIRNAQSQVTGRVIDLVDADGTSHKFIRRSTVAGARWDSPPGVSLRVKEITNAQAVVVAYHLVRPDGVITTAENLQTPLGLSTAAWRVTKIADRNGNELTYGYVGLDLVNGGATVKTPRLSTVRHNRTGAEILVQLAWSAGGQLSSIEFLPSTDRRLTQFDYLAGKLASVTQAAHTTVEGGQRTTEFSYDATNGLLSGVKDARGSTSVFGHAPNGTVHRVTSMVDRRGKTWRWHYGTPNSTTGDAVTVATSPIGPAATTTSDESTPREGQTAYRISDKRRVDLNDRRQAGPNVLAIISAGTGSGPTTRSYGWYANRLTAITDGAGNATSLTYNDLGLLRSVTEPSPNDPATPNLPADAPTTGITTTFEYQYPAAHRYSSCANPAANSTPVSNEGWCSAVADMTRVVAATNVAAQRRITEFAFDAAGNVTRQIQRGTSNPIPTLGAAATTADRATNMTYYSKGGLKTVDGARTDVADVTTFGNTADLAYGGYHRTGQPLTITDARGKPTSFDYSAYGMVTSSTDRDLHQSSATYDARDNRLTVTDAAGSTWEEAWDANDNLLSRTQARGSATPTPGDFQDRFVHDNNDWLTSASTPGADEGAARPTTQYAYNDDGTRASTTSPSAATTTNEFWPNRSLKRSTAPAATSTVAVTDWTYDSAGRVSTETAPAVNGAGQRPVAKTFYTPDGQVARTEITNSSGGWAIARSVYNAHGERIATRGPRVIGGTEEDATAGFNVFGEQTAAGRRLSASKVISTYYGYDATGNQVCIAQPTGTAGQSPTACSGGAATAGGQLVARYGYDVLGRLAAQTVDPVNTPHTVSYGYSDGGQQISRVDNVSGAARRTVMTAFNLDNTLQTRHVIDHGNGKTLTTCYVEPGQAVSSGYDADKNVRTVETRVGSTSSCGGGTRLSWDSYTRDHRGLLSAATKRVVHPAAGSTEQARAQSFTYRADGELLTRTDGGRTTEYHQSPGGQLERVYNRWDGLRTTFESAPSGARLRECRKAPTHICPDAEADIVWNYHPDGALLSLNTFSRPGARVPARTHAGIAYDAGGFRTAETVTTPQPPGSAGTVGGFQALYGHDLAGRLISWTSPFARADSARETDTMSLDDGGNITRTDTTAAEGSDTEVATSTLNAGRLASRVTDSTTALGTVRTNESFSYSPLGEETSRSTTVTPPPNLGTPTSETTTTTYDPAGFTSSSTTGATTVSYTYDPVTERVLTRQEGTTTRIYWSWGDTAEVIAESDAAGADQVRYLNDDQGSAIASQTAAGVWTFLLPDSDRNQTTTVDANGLLLSQKSYRPYGSVEARGTGNRANTTGSPSSMGFQAAITDRTTGAVLVGPRQYDPSIERFTSPDAYVQGLDDLAVGTDELTGNRYLFAAGNPVLFYEDGHKPCEGNFFQKASCGVIRAGDGLADSAWDTATNPIHTFKSGYRGMSPRSQALIETTLKVAPLGIVLLSGAGAAFQIARGAHLGRGVGGTLLRVARHRAHNLGSHGKGRQWLKKHPDFRKHWHIQILRWRSRGF